MRLITLISFVFFLYFSSQQSCSIQNCAQCNSDNASCTQCKEGYTLLNGECPCNDRNCLICSSSFYGGCTQCKANFFLDKSTGTCQSKIEHCLYYTDNGCDFCEYGYKKANGKCEKKSLFYELFWKKTLKSSPEDSTIMSVLSVALSVDD